MSARTIAEVGTRKSERIQPVPRSEFPVPTSDEDTIIRALRGARRKLELLALVPDLIPEAEHVELVALLDSAEITRHGELAAREVMAVPVARGPMRSW